MLAAWAQLSKDSTDETASCWRNVPRSHFSPEEQGVQLGHSKRQILVYFALLATVAIPFTLTLGTVNAPMVAPDFAQNPTPLGYLWSLSVFAVPIAMFMLWLKRNPQYHVEKLAYLGTIAGIFLLGCILDFGFGYSFFRFPNTDAVIGIRLPSFSFETWRFVPNYLPIEEFGFYFLGGTYMISSYLWGVLFWFKRYNYKNHKAETQSFDRIVEFNFKALLLCLALCMLGFVIKKLGPHPEGFSGYFSFLVLMAFLPCMICYNVTKYLINWRAFSFMSFVLLLVSLVYEATLGVPYGWWRYNDDQMLGISITAWSGLPIEAVLLWIAAGFGSVLLFEALRMVFYMERPLRQALFGARGSGRRYASADHERTDLPYYVDNGIGLPVPRGPYVNTRADMANFLVQVDIAKIRAICDRYLNNVLDNDIKYYPFLSVVQMTYAKLEGYATDDKRQRMGLLPEDDLVFWIPTIAVRQVFGIPIPTHLAMFPYRLYVNSAYGLSSGRETYGFNKTIGEFSGSTDVENPDIEMKTLGFKTFDPNRQGELLPLFRLKRVKEGSGSPRSFDKSEDVWAELWKFLLDVDRKNVVTELMEAVAKFIVNTIHPETCSVSIKQYRDVSNPLRACLQQVIEAKTRIDRFDGGGLIDGEYELEISDIASEPIAKDLGIVLTDGKQRGLRGLWVKTAFTMEVGKVIGPNR